MPAALWTTPRKRAPYVGARTLHSQGARPIAPHTAPLSDQGFRERAPARPTPESHWGAPPPDRAGASQDHPARPNRTESPMNILTRSWWTLLHPYLGRPIHLTRLPDGAVILGVLTGYRITPGGAVEIRLADGTTHQLPAARAVA